jgi:thiol-disulfide isomerase/thioredoxin
MPKDHPATRLDRRHACALLAAAPLAARAQAPSDGAVQIDRWPAQRPVPALDLRDLDGRAWTLTALRGRPVVLNFWATWCAPCREEMPSLELMAARHEAQGLQLLGVNFQEGERTVRRFLEQALVSFPILLDRDGAVAKAWQASIFPTTVLVGRDGRPRQVVRGALDWTGGTARGLLQALLG